MAFGSPGAAFRHREPAGRRHQYWSGGGRPRARRRLYASANPRIGDGQRHALPASHLRFHPRHRSDCDDQQPAAGHDREHIDNPAKTVPEFIAWAKANPGKVSMASGGTGSTSHIGGELLKLMTGIDMLHVPYRGGAPAITDLMGGHGAGLFQPAAGIDLEHQGWQDPRAGGDHGQALGRRCRTCRRLANPFRASRPIPGRASARPRARRPRSSRCSTRRSTRGSPTPKIKARLAELGSVPSPMSPAEFEKYIVDETAKWAKVIRQANIPLQ